MPLIRVNPELTEALRRMAEAQARLWDCEEDVLFLMGFDDPEHTPEAARLAVLDAGYDVACALETAGERWVLYRIRKKLEAMRKMRQ